MKRKYYLIDTENVGDNWFGLLEKVKKKDRIITFYTQNHSKRLEEFLLRQVNNPQIIWLECAVGNNALDYQLVGVLAYLIAKHPKGSFCIYANDKGYRKTVDFWESRGIRICQKHPDQKKKAKKKEKRKNKQLKKDRSIDLQQAQVQTKKNIAKDGVLDKQQGKLSEEQYVEQIARIIPLSNLNGWYCALTVILGQKAGRDWYQKIRHDTKKRDELSKNCAGDKRTRGVNLIALVLRAYELDVDKALELYKIIMSHNCKNLNAIKIDFDKITGQKGQNNYYKVIRPVISLLTDL